MAKNFSSEDMVFEVNRRMQTAVPGKSVEFTNRSDQPNSLFPSLLAMASAIKAVPKRSNEVGIHIRDFRA
jgi:hypothetical protein